MPRTACCSFRGCLNCNRHNFRGWLRPVVISVYFIILCVALPLTVWELHKNRAQIHVEAWFIAGCFVFLTIPISLWGILQHLVNYTQPELQRRIVRILWMVPIYATDSWLALRFPKAAIYLDSLRECYEAYVIYNFMTFLLAFLYSEYDFDVVLSGKPQVRHFFPFCMLSPWGMGKTLISRCKQGALSYTVVRIITTAIAFCTELAGKYDEGNLSFKSGWSYIVIINNCSQVWAMYCLVLFYKATHEELKSIKPFGKFLCIKLVVFASFWQGVLIAILVKVGIISSKHSWDFYTVEDVANGIQNFIVCIEMFVFAIAHYYVFSHDPYIDRCSPPPPCCASFVSMWDVSDVRDDLVQHVQSVGNTVKGTVVRNKRKIEATGALQDPEETPLLSNEISSDPSSFDFEETETG
ncbi:transmembrane protein 184C-like [Acropora millepora]|uniref:transmembrane protein 184C-like n=1 Tax=Acropora millepora TaxID=45264 RepID=UPI001CF13491|nr:transmembrane protein 184C-like [Acropora millepora]